MSPGRELDALIAEKVMGVKVVDWPTGREYPVASALALKALSDTQESRIPHYSTSIADAWLVVEKLAQNYHKDTGIGSGYSGHGFVLEHCTENSEGRWICRLPSTVCAPPYEEMDSFAVYQTADTAPLAICLAALKAVGVEV